MSLERKETDKAARRERAKALVRLEMLVIRADTEGLNAEQTAAFLRMHRAEFALPVEQEPLGFAGAAVWRIRVHLRLTSGRQWKATGKRTGRRNTKAALMAARP